MQCRGTSSFKVQARFQVQHCLTSIILESDSDGIRVILAGTHFNHFRRELMVCKVLPMIRCVLREMDGSYDPYTLSCWILENTTQTRLNFLFLWPSPMSLRNRVLVPVNVVDPSCSLNEVLLSSSTGNPTPQW
jgi:hypothetical protein